MQNQMRATNSAVEGPFQNTTAAVMPVPMVTRPAHRKPLSGKNYLPQASSTV